MPTAPIERALDTVPHEALDTMCRSAKQFHSHGWMLGTSGSLSQKITENPLSIAITVSGKDKGALAPSDFLRVTDDGAVFATLADPQASSASYYHGNHRPSGETLVHHAVYTTIPEANAVFHTHSVWSTLCSQLVPPGDALTMRDLEMLKGLGHWDETPIHIPVIANARHIPTLAALTKAAANPEVPGVLVAGHGIYAWGPDLERAKRHIEIFEFLFEHEVRRRSLGL